jgi:hypothetical protein
MVALADSVLGGVLSPIINKNSATVERNAV